MNHSIKHSSKKFKHEPKLPEIHEYNNIREQRRTASVKINEHAVESEYSNFIRQWVKTQHFNKASSGIKANTTICINDAAFMLEGLISKKGTFTSEQFHSVDHARDAIKTIGVDDTIFDFMSSMNGYELAEMIKAFYKNTHPYQEEDKINIICKYIQDLVILLDVVKHNGSLSDFYANQICELKSWKSMMDHLNPANPFHIKFLLAHVKLTIKEINVLRWLGHEVRELELAMQNLQMWQSMDIKHKESLFKFLQGITGNIDQDEKWDKFTQLSNINTLITVDDCVNGIINIKTQGSSMAERFITHAILTSFLMQQQKQNDFREQLKWLETDGAKLALIKSVMKHIKTDSKKYIKESDFDGMFNGKFWETFHDSAVRSMEICVKTPNALTISKIINRVDLVNKPLIISMLVSANILINHQDVNHIELTEEDRETFSTLSLCLQEFMIAWMNSTEKPLEYFDISTRQWLANKDIATLIHGQLPMWIKNFEQYKTWFESIHTPQETKNAYGFLVYDKNKRDTFSKNQTESLSGQTVKNWLWSM